MVWRQDIARMAPGNNSTANDCDGHGHCDHSRATAMVMAIVTMACAWGCGLRDRGHCDHGCGPGAGGRGCRLRAAGCGAPRRGGG